MKVHKVSNSLFLNAGIMFPLCYAGAIPLDLDKTRLATSHEASKVTCPAVCRLDVYLGKNGLIYGF